MLRTGGSVDERDAWVDEILRAQTAWQRQNNDTEKRHSLIRKAGHNYMGHNYIGHNYIGRKYTGGTPSMPCRPKLQWP